MGSLQCMNGKAFGQRAKQATSDLAFGREVNLKTFGHDKYGRTLADVCTAPLNLWTVC